MSLTPALHFVVLVALLAGPGCAVHYVARGADLYSEGYYVEAAEVFERTEARLKQSPPDDRARYGLYRGANFLALGDQPSAERWLKYSQAQLNSEKDALSADERALLSRSLRTLADRPNPAPPPDGTALATTRIGVPDQVDQAPSVDP